jgi:hypothetical protein
MARHPRSTFHRNQFIALRGTSGAGDGGFNVAAGQAGRFAAASAAAKTAAWQFVLRAMLRGKLLFYIDNI